MKITTVVHSSYKKLTNEIKETITNFNSYSEVLGAAERNVIKNVTIKGKTFTIKSFKIPNVINQIVYRFLTALIYTPTSF